MLCSSLSKIQFLWSLCQLAFFIEVIPFFGLFVLTQGSSPIFFHDFRQTVSVVPLFFFKYAAKSLQSCPTLCDPIDGSPPGSPVPGILQARTLEWIARPSSRGSSGPGDRTPVSCIADRFFTNLATREALEGHYVPLIIKLPCELVSVLISSYLLIILP